MVGPDELAAVSIAHGDDLASGRRLQDRPAAGAVSTRRIHLVTVVGGYVKVLPHMLAHYRALGIDSFFINAHLTHADDPVRAELAEITARFGSGIHSTQVGEWKPGTNPAIYARVKAAHPGDWFVIADQDELHAYPDAPAKILDYCDRQGFDYVEGCFLDRVARDGGLPPVRGETPIQLQFPLGGFISFPLLGAYPKKVVAAKGHVAIGWGQHNALQGRGLPVDDLLVQVHHFKWVETLRDRLEARARFRRAQGEPYGAESERFVEYFDTHGGRLDLARPDFYISDCVTEPYRYWDEIRRLYKTI